MFAESPAPRSLERRGFRARGGPQRANVDRDFVVPHFSVAVLLVAGSDRVATVPTTVVRLWQTFVRALPCPLPMPDLEFCAYVHRRSESDAGLEWLIEEMRACLKKRRARPVR